MFVLRGSNIFKRYAAEFNDVGWADTDCMVAYIPTRVHGVSFIQTANMYVTKLDIFKD
jgi:hypothetical protein